MTLSRGGSPGRVRPGWMAWCTAILLVVVAGLWLVYAAATRPSAQEGKRTVSLFSGGEGGAFLPLAKALAKRSREDPKSQIIVNAVPTSGSVANLDEMARCENAISFTFILMPDVAPGGISHEDVRAIALLNVNLIHIVAAADSGIRDIRDLVAIDKARNQPRHRMYIGSKASGTRAAAKNLLQALDGAERRDWIEEWAPASDTTNYQQAADKLEAGEFNVAIFVTSPDASALRQLFTSRRRTFRLIELTPRVAQALEHGYQRTSIVPLGGGAPVATVGAPALVATNKNTDRWILKQFSELIERNRRSLAADFGPYQSPFNDFPTLSTRAEDLNRWAPNVAPHPELHVSVWESLKTGGFVLAILLFSTQILLMFRLRPRPSRGETLRKSRAVFISHGGRSSAWKDLRTFLERSALEPTEFNDESCAGITTIDRLEKMVDSVGFAFIVMTAEDEHADGKRHARENVIHEAGLCYGRLGVRRTILLMEEGCEVFANVAGVGHIQFPSDNIAAAFDQIRGVLEREGMLAPTGMGREPAGRRP